MALGIIVSQFPELHETFILKEFLALREAGIDLRIFSLKQCRDRIIHPETGSLLQVTEYAPLSSVIVWGEAVLAFLRHPLRSLMVLPAALRDGRDPVTFLKALAVTVKSLAFSYRARRRGVTRLHAHWATFPTTSARILAKLLSLPFSFTGHAWDLYVKNPTLKKKLEEAEFVLTCTDYNRRFLSSLSPESEKKIFLNYHGVELNRFQQRERSQTEGKPLILSVGRLVETKGFFTLLQSLSLVKGKQIPFECLIVGEGPLRGALEQEIRQRRLKEVRLVGSLSREEILTYYREAACFVLASEITPNGDRDGIPNVLLEAMAMGIPVVSTRVSGIPELVMSGKNGLLVPEKEPWALAEAFEFILRNPVAAARYAEEARRTVSEKFDSARHLKTLAQLFKERKAKVNVLYVIWSLEMGGAEKLVVSLAEGLDQSRFQPVVCCLNHPGLLAERLTSQGIRVIPLYKRPGVDLPVIPKLIRVIRQERIQIVHTHLWGANVWGRIAAWLAGVPVRISAEHGIPQWRGPLHWRIDRVLSRLCHRIVFAAFSVRDEFCRTTGIHAKKCQVIQNGIDVHRFAPAPDRPRLKSIIGLQNGEKIVLSVGRLAPEKQYDLLLKAWKDPALSQTDALLVIVGDGEQRKSLLALKESLGLDGRVKFVGQQESIEEIYRCADLFLQTSSREALSLAILEAMASGLPVIASSVGDHPRMIIDGENGFLVPSGDTKALVEKILFLLKHPKEAKRIGEAARQTVVAHYSRERMLRETERLYEELLRHA